MIVTFKVFVVVTTEGHGGSDAELLLLPAVGSNLELDPLHLQVPPSQSEALI